MTGIEIALAGYLAFGQLIPQGQQEIVKYGGLQVIHADGAVTLRLKETDRTETAEPDGRHIAICLRDEAYPFSVTRHVKEWNDCAALVWSESGRGEVSRQFHRWARNHGFPWGRTPLTENCR